MIAAMIDFYQELERKNLNMKNVNNFDDVTGMARLSKRWLRHNREKI